MVPSRRAEDGRARGATRAIAALLLTCGFLGPRAALAQPKPGPAFGVSAGMGLVAPDGETPGTGRGFYGELEYVPRPGGWFTPRLYAGALLAGPEGDCGPGVTPCDVSARIGFAGAKVRLLVPVPLVAPFVEFGIGGSAGRFSTRSGQDVDVGRSGVAYHVPVAFGIALGARHTWVVAFRYLFHPELKQFGGGVTLGLELSPARATDAAPPSSPEPAPPDAPRPAPAEAAPEPAPPEPAPPDPAPPEPAPPEPAPPEPAPPAAGPAPTAPPPDVAPAARTRGATHVAARLGYGGGAVYRRDGSNGFVAAVGLLVPQSAGLAFGVPVAPRLLLGGEWNVTFGFGCVVSSVDSASGTCDRVVALQHVLATATWFPLWRGSPARAPAGLVVRGGAGLALLKSWYVPDTSASTPPPPGKDWARAGWAVLGGVGWAFPVGASRTGTLDVGADVAWQWYGRSASEPERSFSSVLYAGLSFH